MKNKKLLIALSLLMLPTSIIGCGPKEDKLKEDIKSVETPAEPQTNKDQMSPKFDKIEFENETIDGEKFTNEDFKNHDLTLVNIWGTWCGPCVAELPELQKIYEEYKDKGVNVAGIVTDTRVNGKKDENAIEAAKTIFEKTGVKYTQMIPDEGEFSESLFYIQAYPTTIFVDKEGKIVGDPIMGAQDYEGWKKTVESKLNEVKK